MGRQALATGILNRHLTFVASNHPSWFCQYVYCLGWGRTKKDKTSDVLLSVDLIVSEGMNEGLLTTWGGVKGNGICQVI